MSYLVYGNTSNFSLKHQTLENRKLAKPVSEIVSFFNSNKRRNLLGQHSSDSEDGMNQAATKKGNLEFRKVCIV